MTSIGTLWDTPVNQAGKRIRAVAALVGVVVDSPKEYTHYVDNYKPEFTSKFPHGKIPALETKEGFLLFEAAPIARYIASLSPNATVLGSTREERALTDQWTNFADTEIHSYTGLLGRLLFGKVAYSKALHTNLVESQLRAYATLEKVLETRTFLVGERITIADISVAAVVQRAANFSLDPPTRAKYPSLLRLVETVVNHPTLKVIFGPLTYPDKPAAYVPPTKETKTKEEKPKAEKAPKPEKQKEEKKKEVESKGEDDEKKEVEPKVDEDKKFDLEDWKRAYSNKDTRGPGGSIEWFYKKLVSFDKEGFSIWRCDFNDKDNELKAKLQFMCANQIRGFFHRLDDSRKVLFGSMGVLGTKQNFVISGVFITKGDDIKLTIKNTPDVDSYEFEKIDLENEEQKKFFEAALAWDLVIDGKTWVDGMVFK